MGETDVEIVDHYVLLCLLAAKRGWKLKLHSDGEKTVSRISKEEHAHLTAIEILDGNESLARESVIGDESLQHAAELLIEDLYQRGAIRR